MFDIWIYVQQRDDEIEEATFGLVTEAKRLHRSNWARRVR